MQSVELLVVGAGPAGLTAGLYGVRSELKTVVLEAAAPGGQMATAPKIENYPGFPDGIPGMELAERMETQARNAGVEIRNFESVESVRKEGDVFVVETSENKYESVAVIVASGLSHKKLGVPGEAEFLGRGISYCATCDAPLFKGKKVAVVGDGTAAANAALTLSELADVKMLVGGDAVRATERIILRRLERSGVEILRNVKVLEIVGEDMVSGVRALNTKTGEEFLLEVDGVFIEVGKVPNTEFLKLDVQLDEKGYIIVDSKQQTSVEGLFAAGDVTSGGVKQVVTAVAQGAIAALNAYKYVRGRD